jgi:hypothetical protein
MDRAFLPRRDAVIAKRAVDLARDIVLSRPVALVGLDPEDLRNPAGDVLDLALSGADIENVAELFLVAPDTREKDVRAQLARPAFSRIADLKIAYLPYTELASHREQIARFGSGMKAIRAISRPLSTLSRSE